MRQHDFRQLAHRILLSTCCVLTCSASLPALADTAGWTQGQGLYGRAINSLAGDGHGTLYAASGVGNFKSSDGGKNWQLLAGSESSNIRKLATDSTGVLYAARYGTSDLLVSRDGGLHWDSPYQLYIENFASDQLGNIYASSGATEKSILIKSSDHGLHWSPITPTSTKDIFIIESMVTDKMGNLFISTSDGMMKSENGGNSWLALNEGLPIDFNGRPETAYHMIADEEGTLFIEVYSGFYKKPAGQNTWTKINGLPNSGLIGSSQGILYVISYGYLYISKDKGNSWSKSAIKAGPDSVIQVIPGQDGKILIAGDIGIASISPSGAFVEQNTGISPEPITAMATKGGLVFAGNKHGLYRSIDHGRQWQSIGETIAPNIKPVISDIAISQNGSVFISIFEHGIFRSRNGGVDWSAVNNGIEQSYPDKLLILPDGSLFASTEKGIFYSNDNGEHWLQDPDFKRSSDGIRVEKLAYDGKNLFANAQYVTSVRPRMVTSFMHKYVRNGGQWILDTSSRPGNYLVDRIVIGSDGNGNPRYLATRPDGLYRFNDADILHWQGTGIQNPDRGLFASGADFYAANRSAVFKSSNGGESWFQLGGTLPYPTSVVADDSGTVYAGTDRGVFQYTPPAAHLANISALASIKGGSNLAIAGFIVSGGSKTVLITARGPSLAAQGVPNVLPTPQLRIFNGKGEQIASNRGIGNGPDSPPVGSIEGLPTDSREAAVKLTLPAGAYSAVLDGVNGASGNALLEVNAVVDASQAGVLSNLSFRGYTSSAADVAIAGFTLTEGSKRLAITAKGPSLSALNVANAVQGTSLTLYDQLTGQALDSNTRQIDSANYNAIAASGYAPANPSESAIVRSFAPGAYSVIARGTNGSQGITLIEINQLP
ncbi:WD40/YVTN/BNR-like repeat-containing protein [Chitinimonas sp.]|uniref:WD40/YVTN/BNR-like repeat-containing protein n=1 Tax=Chitinimonas sp. TaxID=1934313 RepID=UPI0035B45332